jgi:hypothetical protein
MKTFQFNDLSGEYRDLVMELLTLDHGLCSIETFDDGVTPPNMEFKVQTSPDPEWGNLHVPLAVLLVEFYYARRGETVKITGIE